MLLLASFGRSAANTVMKTEDYVILIIKFLPYFPYLLYKLFFFLSLHRKTVVVIKSRIKVPLSSTPSNLPPHRKNRTSGNWAWWENCGIGWYQYKENFTSSWTTPTRLESLPCLRWIWKHQESKAKKSFSFVHCINEVCNVELSAHSSQISD